MDRHTPDSERKEYTVTSQRERKKVIDRPKPDRERKREKWSDKERHKMKKQKECVSE